MKFLLLILTVTLLLVQVTPAMKCWGKLGRCRTTCEQNEVFYTFCRNEVMCCVNPKYVPVGN
ncbi:beta-defensin 121 [Physeter macrocephalus]|uniref:Beta-defensin n=1 Tax=Physeter macrocephalus TaxID=9755 RepID=A0A2Y9T7E0_PHYMC|nr:beta-defensin 121 [Physeter catodon]|eukprot:XP_023984044.1 beta-defensin 121 [Physeter catodon]